MEPRDLVGSARPKEADLRGGRAGPNEQHQLAAGGDDVINGAASEGEGLEEQGEGLMEEQEFSIKEASFQEGSLKLKIQTTKRTKKPPKSLENYICPPEIRMTIRPPAGEGKGGRQGRTGGGAGAGRCPKDEERGPPRKRVSPPSSCLFFNSLRISNKLSGWTRFIVFRGKNDPPAHPNISIRACVSRGPPPRLRLQRVKVCCN